MKPYDLFLTRGSTFAALRPGKDRTRVRVTNVGEVPVTVVLLERWGEAPLTAAEHVTTGEVLDVGRAFEVVGPEAVRAVGALLQVDRPTRCLCETTEAQA
jgi:hypothetical protein